MTKLKVHRSLVRLKAFLQMRLAKVKMIYLSPGNGGTKVGLDDYLAAGHTVDEKTNGRGSTLATATPVSSRRVFLVHGHNEQVKQAVARLLERLDLQPVILHEQPDMNRTTIEKLEAVADVGFAVILMTGDDRGGSMATNTGEYQPRARQNVLLEMGFFMGRLGRERVCVLCEPGVEIPSDYSGVLYKALDSAGAWRWELAREIAAAELSVDFNRLK